MNRARWSMSLVTAVLGAALAGCPGTGGGGGVDLRGPPRFVVSDLGLYPGSASVGEGHGEAYVLGTFDVAAPDSTTPYSPVVRVGGHEVATDFVEVDGTTLFFGLYLPTLAPATFTVSVQLATGGVASSNLLSGPFTVTQDLDPTFGASGVVVNDDSPGVSGGVDARATSLAIQQDGRIVVGGTATGGMVERYLADGRPDPSFAAGGRYLPPRGWATEIHAVAVQPDGKIVAVGTGPYQVSDGPQAVVARLLADGTPDASFGAGGIAATSFHYDATANALALQPDGKIVIAGKVSTGTDVLALVARFTADGALDGAFADGGLFLYSDPAGGWDELFAVALDPDGRAVAAGKSSPGDAVALPGALVLRLAPDGTLDPSFGCSGVVHGQIEYDEPRGVAIQAGGRILVGGGSWSYASAANVAFVAGLTPDGLLDETFGDGGAFWSRALAPYGMIGTGFTASPAGEPVIVGYRGYDVVVIRLTRDGQGDVAFSGDGFAAMTGSGIVWAGAIAVQPDGRLVVAGESTYHDGYSTGAVLLARFVAPGG